MKRYRIEPGTKVSLKDFNASDDTVVADGAKK